MPAIRCAECRGRGVERLDIYSDGELVGHSVTRACGACRGTGDAPGELRCCECGEGLEAGAFVLLEDGALMHRAHRGVQIRVA